MSDVLVPGKRGLRRSISARMQPAAHMSIWWGVQDLGFGADGLVLRGSGVGFGLWGVGFGVWGSGFGEYQWQSSSRIGTV